MNDRPDPVSPAPHAEEPDDDGLGLVEVVTALGQDKGLILGVTTIAIAIGVAVALLTPPVYTARTLLLPPQQGQAASSSVLASLGVLAAATGAASLKSPEELYVSLMKSETVANELIGKFLLRDRFEKKNDTDTRKELANRTHITADRKSGLITVEYEDRDAEFAARVANGYSEQLRRLMTRVAVTDAQQRRLFYEQQLEQAKDDLAKAEVALKLAQDKTGLLSVDAQTQGNITASAQLRAQVMTREVQIKAMAPFSGPENPDIKRLRSEVSSLREQLTRLEGGTHDESRGDAGVSQALSNVRIYREMKYQEAVYAAMLQQFQLARVDEAKEAPLVQQVDVATPPDKRSRPKRALIVLIAAVSGLGLGALMAFVRRALRRTAQDEAGRQRWEAMRRAWVWRGR